MRGFFEWLSEKENKFFAIHLAFVFIFSIVAEVLLNGWTTFVYPALVLISVVSFLYNYPVEAIKAHGLFSEYLIELRLLWLVMLGVFLEYLVYQVLENTIVTIPAAIVLLIGVIVLFYARSTLQEKITQARGFK